MIIRNDYYAFALLDDHTKAGQFCGFMVILLRPNFNFSGSICWKDKNSSQKTSDIELLKNTYFIISANENSRKGNFFKKLLSYIFSTFNFEHEDIHGCYKTCKGLKTKIGDTNCINILLFFANSADHTNS